MLRRPISALLAAALVVATIPPPPAQAQFGLKRAFRVAPGRILRAPTKILPVPGIGRGVGILPLMVLGGPFRGALGVVAAVAVGTIILERLSRSERTEVARRAKVVVAKNPDQRVQDVYTSKDGTKQVTIVAEPMQKASDLKNDPSIQLASDKVVTPGATNGTEVAAANTPSGGTTTAPAGGGTPTATDAKAPAPAAGGTAPAAKPVKDTEVVYINEIPPETQCRKVITELEIKKKKGEAEKNSNTAIFCQTAPGEWKPASA